VLLLISTRGLPWKPHDYASHTQCGRQKHSALLLFVSSRHGGSTKQVSSKRINGEVLRRQPASTSVSPSLAVSFLQRQYLTETEFQRGSFSPNRELLDLILLNGGRGSTDTKNSLLCVYFSTKEKKVNLKAKQSETCILLTIISVDLIYFFLCLVLCEDQALQKSHKCLFTETER